MSNEGKSMKLFQKTKELQKYEPYDLPNLLEPSLSKSKGPKSKVVVTNAVKTV